MDLQFWIYVIAVIAVILTRALKKAPKGPQPTADHSPGDTDRSGNKPMTFEELLREIQDSKTPQRPVDRQPEIKRQPAIGSSPPIKSYEVDYDDDIAEEEQDLETIPARDDRSTEVYENAKRMAFQRLSLEETMKVGDTDTKFIHFKGYEEVPQSTVVRDILRDFRDPDSFRKAFIMAEILKRKF